MARSFNGTSDMIVADGGGVWSDSSAFSISLWVKGALKANQAFYSEGNSSSSGCLLLASDLTTGAHLRYFLRANVSTVVDLSGTATVLDGNWHHICVTRTSARSMHGYVDGVADISHNDTVMSDPLTRVGFGVLRRSSNSGFFAGSIGEVSNFSRTLSAAEAVALASGLPASHLAPDHYWPLWGRDSPEPDIGTTAHVKGTITGTSFASGSRVDRELLVL